MAAPRWRRRTEIRARAAESMGIAVALPILEIRARAVESVFHFDVQGQVAKSTHGRLPWLIHLRRQPTSGRSG